jgi:hypothetical protein
MIYVVTERLLGELKYAGTKIRLTCADDESLTSFQSITS